MTPSRHLGALSCLLMSTVVAAQPRAGAARETHEAAAFPAPRHRALSESEARAELARYPLIRAQLAEQRRNLATRWRLARTRSERNAVLSEASEAASRGLVDLVAPWIGTPWAFHGTTQVPRQGTIACGYFVSTLLQHLGLEVERVRLAQQASENIVKTLSPAGRIWRFRTGSVPAVLDVVRAQPERWFVVGLDLHVGLLVRLDDGEIRFCHASYLEPVQAVCEPAESAAAMQSNYHVVGALFTDDLTRAWLEARPLPTRR